MKLLKTFESFIKEESINDTLFIFDFDDTIVKSPSFEELAIEYLQENLTIKDLLDKSVERIGISINDLKWENGRLFVDDPDFKIKEQGNWIRKGNRIYLVTPHAFPYNDISMSNELKELADLYKKVENKCIVTARPEDVRDMVSNKLINLGLGLPKYGLHMFPVEKGAGNPGYWKGKKIVEILKETGFKKAHFYDDNKKVLNKANKIVMEEMPHIEWKITRVY
jgi:hypothetical protein